MQSQSTPAEQDAQADGIILGLLSEEGSERPWSVDEIAREVGDPIKTADTLMRLHAAGLVHRLGEFVFASRAALRAEEIAL